MKCVPKEITQNVGAYPHSEMFFWTLTAQTSFKGQEGFQQTIFLVATFSPSPSPPCHPFLLPLLHTTASPPPPSPSPSSPSPPLPPPPPSLQLLTSRYSSPAAPTNIPKNKHTSKTKYNLICHFVANFFFAKMSCVHCNFFRFGFGMNAQPNDDRMILILFKLFTPISLIIVVDQKFCQDLRECVQEKRIFYNQADLKGWPPSAFRGCSYIT